MEAPLLNSPTSEPQSTSSSGKQPMSATLRERLKKARRSFNSAFTVAKHLKISEKNECVTNEEMTLSKKEPCSISQYEDKHLGKAFDKIMNKNSNLQDRELCESDYNKHSKTGQNSPRVLLESNCSHSELLEKKMKLEKQIREKEELLRRLKLVKMYRSKNNPTELHSLIAKWRESAQIMLYELQSVLSTDGKKLSITELIDNFGLEDQLLHYIRTEEDFKDNI
ncbi:swi5-dependent recombination DNA repair protein 1 homolog [Heteronotia binoei]|uniref:swi5-dependent recombination DNA repair protein 1 homolog n=1 Tax=Heteronotia binoei TaxID=13085 RepID=UPI00292F9F63|nr:swi5-dependent recombination DNA repair protein 1 homolog [Heteronotia binoei]XP_060097690.1 swi5-dependent recombination DNA repair protein 1 homolog [Heteronotia binoei]XP_060097691.1 swi5-dependent recombination DNA repair protein 1 homolog [Heteronotia binoei]